MAPVLPQAGLGDKNIDFLDIQALRYGPPWALMFQDPMAKTRAALSVLEIRGQKSDGLVNVGAL